MSDPGFDARLERLFAQAPRVAAPEQFAARVEARLDREWSLRRGLIGVAGLVGGVIAVTQTVGAEMSLRLGEVMTPLQRNVSEAWAGAWSADLQTESLLTGEAVWVMAALAGMAVSLAVARAVDAI